MTDSIRAVVAHTPGKAASIQELEAVDLPDHDTLVEVSFSNLNYKDGLAVTGKGKICRSFPMVCGIDLAGTIIETRSDRFAAGDAVLVNGFGLSEKYWGGYAQRQRVSSEWLVRQPQGFTAEQCMGIGTAGYTAMLCVHALQDHGVLPSSGPVVVTGASGGVGSVAVSLLSKLGFEVHASTGRVDENAEWLNTLGAAKVIGRDFFAGATRPLEASHWAGGVDCVGGEVLAAVLAQMRYAGCVAACGLAGSYELGTTVMPFILRGVTLAGVDSVMASMDKRERAWQDLANLLSAEQLANVYRVKPMSEVLTLGEDIIAGRVKGRVVIDVNA